MGKQILVMTGSPRKEGNSDMLADAFIKGAVAGGHHVDKFMSAFYRLNGCLGCNCCWSTALPCVQEDDFNGKLAPLLEKADVLVFCTPLYAFSFPAQIKAPIDRLFPYCKKNLLRPLKVKESALIICGADDGEEPFGAAIQSYRLLAGFFGWKSRAELIVPKVNKKGDVIKTDGLRLAQELGRGNI